MSNFLERKKRAYCCESAIVEKRPEIYINLFQHPHQIPLMIRSLLDLAGMDEKGMVYRRSRPKATMVDRNFESKPQLQFDADTQSPRINLCDLANVELYQ